ncbi:MAG: hydroxyacid dehydrogenase [Dehalococcoidia bacterium]|nr:MAG: hydroxyacid dehydrogenase [Dehalococcoidia bacterium]
MKKILVSPSSFGKCGFEPINILEQNGYEIINNPFGRKLTEDEVIELASDCVGIVAGVEPLTARVMDALPKLKCISRVGVGMDSVDLEYAKDKGITVVNTPDGPTRSVAEMIIAMTFSLLRKIPLADANIKKGIWKKEIGNLLFEKTVGIVGLGRIGKMVAEMFSKLGNTVIGFDLYPDEKWANQNSVKLVNLDELMQKSDIVSLHVPPNKDKTAIIGKAQLSKMKKSAFLINAARGGVVDETALFDFLKNNNIAGAAIDVFLIEPYKGPFTKLKNVILTPHLGSYAAEGKLQMEIDAVKNLIESLR